MRYTSNFEILLRLIISFKGFEELSVLLLWNIEFKRNQDLKD